MVTVLRPLSTSELLDRTFHLYRNNFLVFVGITAIPQLVVLALHLGNVAMVLERQAVAVGVTIIVAGLASYVAIEISHAATIVAVSNLHLDRPAAIGTSYSLAKSSMLRVIGISIGVGIATGIGFLFMVIPGIYLGRNLMRGVDILPGFYAVGIICMMCNKQDRRVGDYVVGAIVVHDKAVDSVAPFWGDSRRCCRTSSAAIAQP